MSIPGSLFQILLQISQIYLAIISGFILLASSCIVIYYVILFFHYSANNIVNLFCKFVNMIY